MAHFAELTDNIVTRVIVVSNNVLKDNQGNEQELLGIDFCKSIYGANTEWVQTSYNSNFRYNFAGNGYTYDETRDAFISPEPDDAIGFNAETCQWIVPEPELPSETSPE
jgi:hypothetical protein